MSEIKGQCGQNPWDCLILMTGTKILSAYNETIWRLFFPCSALMSVIHFLTSTSFSKALERVLVAREEATI
jgi:hypothetical protein